jgi:predicted DNA-binding transcriptional regulator AlpA
MEELHEYITQGEVMRLLKVSRPLLLRLRKHPAFPASQLGRAVLYHKQQLLTWLREHKDTRYGKKAWAGLTGG